MWVTNDEFRCPSICSRNALDSGNDKGVRFRFPDGLPGRLPLLLPPPPLLRHRLTPPLSLPGRVVCAAHNDHWVGIAQGDNVYLNQWSTNLDSDDWLGTAEAVGDGIELYYSDGYAGKNTIGTPGESLISLNVLWSR